jgi:hypothetical protein
LDGKTLHHLGSVEVFRRTFMPQNLCTAALLHRDSSRAAQQHDAAPPSRRAGFTVAQPNAST